MSVKLEYFLHINFPNRLQNIFVKMSSFFSLLRLFPVTAFTTIHALFNFFQLRAVLHFLCAMHCGKIVCTKQKTQKRILHTDFDFFILHFFLLFHNVNTIRLKMYLEIVCNMELGHHCTVLGGAARQIHRGISCNFQLVRHRQTHKSILLIYLLYPYPISV